MRTPKFGPRIKESKRQHLIDEIHQHEIDAEYHFYKELGMAGKE